MATSLFNCPPPAELPDIPDFTCPEAWDQIQKFAFQRIQATPSFTATTIKAAATWTPLLAASDDTKIVITPYIPGVVIPPGEILKEGGNDNTTLNGIPRINGLGFVAVTSQTQNIPAAIRTALQSFVSESAIQPGFTNIWMYMFNRFGQIIANADGSGIPVYNILGGDVGTEGFNRPNMMNFGFDLAPGWSKTATLFTPTVPFNPLNLKAA